MVQSTLTYADYRPSHPWYYKLGGDILRPKAIVEMVRASGYQGYAVETIATADRMAEPRRSERLRALRAKFSAELERDFAVYRAKACQLRSARQVEGTLYCGTTSRDIDMAMSLKFSHIYNGFAHLIRLDDLLNQQGDLFGF